MIYLPESTREQDLSYFFKPCCSVTTNVSCGSTSPLALVASSMSAAFNAAMPSRPLAGRGSQRDLGVNVRKTLLIASRRPGVEGFSDLYGATYTGKPSHCLHPNASPRGHIRLPGILIRCPRTTLL